MPELPEVETVRRGLVPVLEGARIIRAEARRPDLRWPFPPRFAQTLTGRRVERLRRRGKYLLAELDDGNVLLMHLGMSGSFRVDHAKPAGSFHHPRSINGRHDHVVLNLGSGATVTFNDPRRFGAMLIVGQRELVEHRLLRRLGPEPLEAAFDGAYLARALRGRKTSLKAALSDQRLVAGLGNIYVCEALHRARLSPRRTAGTLALANNRLLATRLAAAVKRVLRDAIAAGGSTLRNYVKADGELGLFQHRFRVYDRVGEPCPTRGCRGRIRRIVQGGRSTFYCPVCQR